MRIVVVICKIWLLGHIVCIALLYGFALYYVSILSKKTYIEGHTYIDTHAAFIEASINPPQNAPLRLRARLRRMHGRVSGRSSGNDNINASDGNILYILKNITLSVLLSFGYQRSCL